MRTLLLVPLPALVVACVFDLPGVGDSNDTGAPAGQALHATVDIDQCHQPDSGMPASPETSIEVTDAGELLVTYADIHEDCCASPTAEATLTAGTIVVDLQTHQPNASWGCDCACVSDFVVTTEPLDPGTYEVDARRSTATVAQQTVTIP